MITSNLIEIVIFAIDGIRNHKFEIDRYGKSGLRNHRKLSHGGVGL